MAIIFIDRAEELLFQWLLGQKMLNINPDGKSLDIGCGSKPRNPFKLENLIGCDIRSEHEKVIQCDLLRDSLPFPDKTFTAVTAFDFIEHVPRVALDPSTRFPFIQLMNEIHRVLESQGYFYSRTPAYPHPEAFQDPTHVNIITDKTFPMYFCGNKPLASMYGFEGSFKLVFQSWHEYHLISILEKH